MAQRLSAPDSGRAKQYPPEAYNYTGDVTTEAVAALRKEIGIDYSTDEWETVDEFGHVVKA